MNITQDELLFVQNLSGRTYTNQGLTNGGSATDAEENRLKDIKRKLDSISGLFKASFDSKYGAFDVAKNRNPLDRQSRMRHVWSGIYKGASKKHFAAQISFVISTMEPCLDVGFYFGIGDAPDLKAAERTELQMRLRQLGNILRTQIQTDASLNEKFYELFEYGFKAYATGSSLTSDEWLNRIGTAPANCSIIYKLFPENGVVSVERIALCVDMVISFMDAIPADGIAIVAPRRRTLPLSAEERAEQARRFKEIGDKGEQFSLKWEKNRLKDIGIQFEPIHVALKSDSYHYDIESVEGDEPLYIEVKTTVLKKRDSLSKRFYISNDEYSFYTNNPEKYRLYRVYDIEGTPSLEVIDMEQIEIIANSYNALIRQL